MQYFDETTEQWHLQLRKQMDEKISQLQTHENTSPSSHLRYSSTNPQDKEALVALYSTTNGKYWFNSTRWMKGDPCDDGWHGLYCINGRVLQINLVYNNMSGPLPAKLAQADMLQVLRLYSNKLIGTIPTEILQMKSLQILDLVDNQITGALPDAISMPNLTSLILYLNQIKGSIPSQWDTPQLEILEVSSNKLVGSIPDLSACSELTILTVSRNSLTGELPSSLGSLEKLQQLWTFNNNFNKPQIPSSWKGMMSLQNLQIDGLYGEIPSFIGDSLSMLTELALINGNLTGQFDPGLCNLQHIEGLQLFQNQLSGLLPTCICDLISLTELELSDNGFTGSIPFCLGSLSELTLLYLSRNNLSGILPTSIGSLAKLQIMDVSSNLLTGPVPSTFAGLTEIVGFALSYNKLYELENGLEPLYDRIKDYSCGLYSNPWSCPLPSSVPTSCGAQCSKCNTGSQHTYCSTCVGDNNCGWCNEGPNCLEGSASGPYSVYRCSSHDWSFGSASSCP